MLVVPRPLWQMKSAAPQLISWAPPGASRSAHVEEAVCGESVFFWQGRNTPPPACRSGAVPLQPQAHRHTITEFHSLPLSPGAGAEAVLVGSSSPLLQFEKGGGRCFTWSCLRRRRLKARASLMELMHLIAGLLLFLLSSAVPNTLGFPTQSCLTLTPLIHPTTCLRGVKIHPVGLKLLATISSSRLPESQAAGQWMRSSLHCPPRSPNLLDWPRL